MKGFGFTVFVDDEKSQKLLIFLPGDRENAAFTHVMSHSSEISYEYFLVITIT